MAILAKTKDDDHFYIRLGQRTRQIKDAGLGWLRVCGQIMPRAGERVDLNSGHLRYLKDLGYLYIYNIDYEKRLAQHFASSSPEIEEDGPSLLLKLDSSATQGDFAKAGWHLQIKINEINTAGRDVLIKKEDVAVGCDLSNPASMVELRFLQNPDCWPFVKPQSADYPLYYKDCDGGIFLLKEAISTSGLLDNWQGNVFCACTEPELEQYWLRCHTKSSISLQNKRGLYWLARMGQEPAWPGVEQMLGQPQDDWQLWHLQLKEEELAPDSSLVEYERWLSYRDIRLNYPRWRIHVLNPFSSSIEANHYRVQSGSPLLFECIPPTRPAGDVALTIISSSSPKPGDARLLRQVLPTMPLHHDVTNYLRFSVPYDRQKYRLNVCGEADRMSLRIQVAPRLSGLPDWLDGFRCSLKTADKHYPLYAFTYESAQSAECYQIQVPADFTFDELTQLTWDCSPAELFCSVRYECPDPQGGGCYETTSPDTMASELTQLWQNSIWDKVRACSWVKLTLDTGSFGRIMLKFQLQPVEVELAQLETWWTNAEMVTTLLWLSQSAQSTNKGTHSPLLPGVQMTLKQLCQPDMPTHITAALLRLSSCKLISSWAYVRLQTLLAEILLVAPIIAEK